MQFFSLPAAPLIISLVPPFLMTPETVSLISQQLHSLPIQMGWNITGGVGGGVSLSPNAAYLQRSRVWSFSLSRMPWGKLCVCMRERESRRDFSLRAIIDLLLVHLSLLRGSDSGYILPLCSSNGALDKALPLISCKTKYVTAYSFEVWQRIANELCKGTCRAPPPLSHTDCKTLSTDSSSTGMIINAIKQMPPDGIVFFSPSREPPIEQTGTIPLLWSASRIDLSPRLPGRSTDFWSHLPCMPDRKLSFPTNCLRS